MEGMSATDEEDQTSASKSLKRRARYDALEEDERELDIRSSVDGNLKLLLVVKLISPLCLEGANLLRGVGTLRLGNVHRDRTAILKWSNELDDTVQKAVQAVSIGFFLCSTKN